MFLGVLPQAGPFVGHRSTLFEYLWLETRKVNGPCFARELFAGHAGLTRALRTEGISCRNGMEAFPTPRSYLRFNDLEQDDVFLILIGEIIAGFYAYLHFGAPCSKWGPMARMNAASRSLDNPDGTRPLTWPEHRSLVQADRTAVLCLLLAVNKGFFTTENPLGSLLFCSTPL